MSNVATRASERDLAKPADKASPRRLIDCSVDPDTTLRRILAGRYDIPVAERATVTQVGAPR